MKNNMQWFIVSVRTSCEDKVAKSIREKIDEKKLNSLFGEILIPTREVSEIKSGKRVKVEKKFFPGYIIIQMILSDETFSLVRGIPHVLMFLGKKKKPVPVSEAEARRLQKQVEEGGLLSEDIEFEIGQEVHVIDGPFVNFNGIISDVDNLKQKMSVKILVFGRETNVELDFSQVEKL